MSWFRHGTAGIDEQPRRGERIARDIVRHDRFLRPIVERVQYIEHQLCPAGVAEGERARDAYVERRLRGQPPTPERLEQNTPVSLR